MAGGPAVQLAECRVQKHKLKRYSVTEMRWNNYEVSLTFPA